MIIKDRCLETTGRRVLLALIVGATVVAAITTIYYLTDPYQNFGAAYFGKYGFSNGSDVFVNSFSFWMMLFSGLLLPFLASLCGVQSAIVGLLKWFVAYWRGKQALA